MPLTVLKEGAWAKDSEHPLEAENDPWLTVSKKTGTIVSANLGFSFDSGSVAEDEGNSEHTALGIYSNYSSWTMLSFSFY